MQERIAEWWHREEYLAPALVGSLTALAFGTGILALFVGWRPGPVTVFLVQLMAAVIAALAIVWLLAERARQQLAAAPLLERIADLEAEVEAAQRQHAQTERRLRHIDDTAAAHSQTLFGEVLGAEQTIAALAEEHARFAATIADLREEYQRRDADQRLAREALVRVLGPATQGASLVSLARQVETWAATHGAEYQQALEQAQAATVKAEALQAAFDALPPASLVTPVPWAELLDTCRKGNPAGNKRQPQYLAGTWKTVIQQRARAMGLDLVHIGPKP